jgi:rhamnosyltransferase
VGDPAEVCAVVVTYFPDWDRLDLVLARLAEQVENIVVVDNSGDPEVVERLQGLDAEGKFSNVVVAGSNIGIGAAQNLGLDAARRVGSTHVLLLDQDSVPARGMVETLLHAEQRLSGAGKRVAAVGPTSASEVVRGAAPREVVMLISSGSLIKVSVLAAVGDMDETLFIDQVDTEWCLRARSLGYRCYLTDAEFDHLLGDDTRTVWVGRSRSVSTHSPERHYFNFRNSVALYRRSYVPASYGARDSLRLAKLFVYFTLMGHPRGRHVRMMVEGVRDGWNGRAGNPFAFVPPSGSHD